MYSSKDIFLVSYSRSGDFSSQTNKRTGFAPAELRLTIADDNPRHICRRGRKDRCMSILVSLTQATQVSLQKKRTGKSYQRHTSVRLRLRSSRFRRREQKNHTRGTRQSDSGYAVLASEEENRKIIPEAHVSQTQATQFSLQKKRTEKSYQRHTSV